MNLLTTKDVASILRKSERFVRDEWARRNLKGAKFGGELHFTEADVTAYIEAHMNVPKPAPRRKRRAA